MPTTCVQETIAFDAALPRPRSGVVVIIVLDRGIGSEDNPSLPRFHLEEDATAIPEDPELSGGDDLMPRLREVYQRRIRMRPGDHAHTCRVVANAIPLEGAVERPRHGC
eukprot:scaffold7998_cov258-Pinguiococcus_pyrenoidosus.AAC.5